jgi:hypothetical protein
VVLGKPWDVFLQRHVASGSHNPGLAHAAAHHLAETAGAEDKLIRAGQNGAA